MKKSVFIPPPPQGFRLPPASKYAKGRAPRKIQGRYEYGGGTPGAFGGGADARAAKEEFLRKSNDEAKRLGNERTLKRLYADWRANMTPEELALARKLKVHLPAGANGEFGKPKKDQVDLEFLDPSDLPESQVSDHPVDNMEPQSPFSVAIDALDSDEITDAADCFSAALTWALDVPDQRDLVGLGRRAMVLIYGLRPDLLLDAKDLPWITSFQILEASFWNQVFGDCRATGEIFGRVLEWVRRGNTVSAIGERLCLVAYVVRPTMIDSPTLEKLGEVMNKTRQAKDKLAQCLRDTFAGLKAVAMRGERTRTACKLAH